MKHRDVRVFAMCQHLRGAIDLWERIAAEAFIVEKKETTAPPPSPQLVPATPAALPTEKLTYNMKEAVAAVGVSRSSLYKALSDGALTAVKIGNRTLIPAESLRSWLLAHPLERKRS
ncbi:MAG: helix-turn-helix domain-containing protein [Vitreimonas sp.]